MFELYDNTALRELERRAGVQAGLAEDELMRRAGQAAWRTLLGHWPDARRIIVLAGPGNNGGDGWVLAQHALLSGRSVCVLQAASLPPSSKLAQQMAQEYRDAGGRVEIFTGELPHADVIVDALFGIGLARAPQGEPAALIAAANAHPAEILALDTPSGVDAETGHVPGAAIDARLTLQFIAAHAGLATGRACNHVGALGLAPLDVPRECFDGLQPRAHIFVEPVLLCRKRDSHKGDYGRVLVVGGDHGMGGAVLLCAEAALRSGAGWVQVATRAEHHTALLSRCPEAMTLAGDEALGDALTAADAIALGTGLGQSDWAQAHFNRVLASGKPCVLDADALNLLAAAPKPVPQALLTPHPGEAARLLGCTTADIARDRIAAACALAERYQCAVVLKGAGSVIAAPGHTPNVLAVGNPGMASAGMGDTLTGIITTLLAQGYAPMPAACIGAWLHGRAGDIAAQACGEASLLARDVTAKLFDAISECLQ
ncbi:bifunctional ADP-dependent NAD(P)H-hydrate dehydratase/NAD(P)H-hydrate epimerase [Lysobacteraceae bacterium NML120232]|nr:bifunctional ADP-dependent NAD(P)H-hydrate dehydratase/NAD(P)H-hydrate epimerase [Xanthomonadaceae bacterium NML08-0793]PJK09480.1 bifunctional ADP-dependent NAD(P)H-hydrate dehydratase/NAD(P)H-hydrate epimerase [Xanthomonadaceae bacterium NML120232]